MKTPLPIIASFLLIPVAASPQSRIATVQVNSDSNRGAMILSNSVSIATNELATIVSRDSTGGSNGGPTTYWIKDGITNGFNVFGTYASQAVPLVVAGPALFVLSTQGGFIGWGYCTIQIDPQAFPPGQTLVIPQGSGAYISLEASPDLRVWTNSVPGPYTNPAIANLFFRIRADRIP